MQQPQQQQGMMPMGMMPMGGMMGGMHPQMFMNPMMMQMQPMMVGGGMQAPMQQPMPTQQPMGQMMGMQQPMMGCGAPMMGGCGAGGVRQHQKMAPDQMVAQQVAGQAQQADDGDEESRDEDFQNEGSDWDKLCCEVLAV